MNRAQCSAFAVGLAMLATFVATSVRAAVAWVYWNETVQQRLMRTPPDGSHVETAFDGLGICGNLALDPIAGKMHWLSVEGTTAVMRRANLDGSDAEILITLDTRNTDFTQGLAIDPESGYLFWGRYYEPGIQRANLDGSDVRFILTWDHAGPGDLAVDPVHRHLYWGDWVNHEIRRADYDGANQVSIVDAPRIPFQIALDLQRRNLYWSESTESGGAHIYRSNLNGDSIHEFSRGEVANELLMDADGGGLFVVQRNRRILRLSLDGTSVQTIVDGLDGAWHGALQFETGPVGVSPTSWGRLRAGFRGGKP